MSEATPLLSAAGGHPVRSPKTHLLSPYQRMLAVAFCLSVAFAYTSTPLLYNIRTSTCYEYYKTHPPYEGEGDMCSNREIESSTAQSISYMITLTTIAGMLNLLTTGYLMKRFGVRFALIAQTSWPILRNVCQTIAVMVSGKLGIQIFIWTQLITILGGGAGYILAANSFVAAVVPAEDRTGAFGQLQGVCMAGTAAAYTLGGLTGDYLGPAAPFKVTLVLLICSTFLSYFALPYIPPTPEPVPGLDTAGEPKNKVGLVAGMLRPMKVFGPHRITEGGKRYWGIALLGVGCFTAVLATSYVPLMMQYIGTNLYGFRPTENGYVMSLFSASRALFLTMAFPRIIKRGRVWYRTKDPKTTSPAGEDLAKGDPAATQVLEATSEESSVAGGNPVENSDPDSSLTPTPDSAFDLAFLKWSIFIDACLTSILAFSSAGWHLYLAALFIPLASGTAPAAKGVLLELIRPDQRTDALSAISLIEVTAMTVTVSLFGTIFALLTAAGKPNLVFILNGATALIATGILMLVRIPSKRLDENS